MTRLLDRLRADPRLRWAAIGLAALAGVALLGLIFGGQAAPDSLAASFTWGEMLAKMAFVLGLLYLSLAALRRWQARSPRTRQLAIAETLRLSPRQALHLVRVGERLVLVGASDAQISLLLEVEAPACPQDADTASTPPAVETLHATSVRERLARWLPTPAGAARLGSISE